MSENAGAAVLIATHGLLLPAIYYCLSHWVILAFSHFFLTFCASLYYHICRAYSQCVGPPDIAYAMSVKIDHYFALGNITLIAFAIFTTVDLISIASGRFKKIFPKKPDGMYYKELFATVSLFQICQAVILVTVLLCDVQASLIPALVTILATSLSIWLHMTLVTGGRLGFYSKFNLALFGVAILFTACSLYFFYDDSDFYSWNHAFWHVFSFLGTTFIIVAATTPKHVNFIDPSTHKDAFHAPNEKDL